MEVIGRFASEEEAKKYKVAMSTPVWLPADQNVDLDKTVKKNIETLRHYEQ